MNDQLHPVYCNIWIEDEPEDRGNANFAQIAVISCKVSAYYIKRVLCLLDRAIHVHVPAQYTQIPSITVRFVSKSL